VTPPDDPPCAAETLSCTQAEICAALFDAFDIPALMANTEGTALLTCQSAHGQMGECGADVLACFGDETCAGVIEPLYASSGLSSEEKVDLLVANGWCVKPTS
jgi:hypothetical protein